MWKIHLLAFGTRSQKKGRRASFLKEPGLLGRRFRGLGFRGFGPFWGLGV